MTPEEAGKHWAPLIPPLPKPILHIPTYEQRPCHSRHLYPTEIAKLATGSDFNNGASGEATHVRRRKKFQLFQVDEATSMGLDS